MRAPRPARPILAGLSLAGLLAGLSLAGPALADPDLAALKAQSAGFAKLAARVRPAVVSIEVEQQGLRPAGHDELLERFFGPRHRGGPQPDHPFSRKGQGSGFIIDADGTIVTNNHVVEGATEIKVHLADGRRFDGRIVGTDPQTDLAVIDIDGPNLPTLPLGRSEALQVGEWVMAVGSPFGLSYSVTTGVVSATGRTRMGITDYEDFIQTDAAINPGNSGGPLINLDGEVVGINTAIFSRSGGSMGIGFAIPMDMARPIVAQLKTGAAVRRGFLGVMIQPLDPALAEQFGLAADTRGVLISEVTAGSAAAAAGVEPGDVVVELDGRAVEDPGRFRNRVAQLGPGKPVQITLLREGARKTVSVTLDERPGDPRARGKAPAAQAKGAARFGLEVAPLDRALARRFKLKQAEGLVITGVAQGSPAAAAGLTPGLRIVTVGRSAVRNLRELDRALDARDDAVLRVEDERGSRFVVLKAP